MELTYRKAVKDDAPLVMEEYRDPRTGMPGLPEDPDMDEKGLMMQLTVPKKRR